MTMFSFINRKLLDMQLSKLHLEEYDIILLKTSNIKASEEFARKLSNSKLLNNNPILVLDKDANLENLKNQPEDVKMRIREALNG